jgi:hypothetical protein
MERFVTPDLIASLRDKPMSTAQVIGHFGNGALATPLMLQSVAHELREAGFHKLATLDGDGYRQLWFPLDIDEPADDADRARLIAEAEPEILKALRKALEALELCEPAKGRAADLHHNAMSYGRAVIAKAEGTGR